MSSSVVINLQPRSAITTGTGSAVRREADGDTLPRRQVNGRCGMEERARGEERAGAGVGAGAGDRGADMHQHQSLLRGYFARRVRHPQDVDDYVQDVYLRALSAAPTEKVDNWRGFLLRVAATLLVDRFRRDSTRRRDEHQGLDESGELTDDQAFSPEHTAMVRQELAVLEETLKQVDPLARNVFLLVRVDGLSHRDVAERLGLDVKMVSRHVERVLAFLARTLAEQTP